MTTALQHVAFKNGPNEVVGDLRLPDGFDEHQTYPALVLSTPGSSVKEQIGGTYAQKLAERGFVTLTFDPSYQGESGGEPRDLENPSVRIEDLRCALDFLMTLPYIGEDRVGVLGICAGGGYAVTAAMLDHRFKALGTVVAVNLGRAWRQASGSAGGLVQLLEAVGQQRTAEARGQAQRRDQWIPDTLEEAKAAGVTDRDVLDAVEYYRTPRGHNPNSTNRLYFPSNALMLGNDAFHLVEELLTQPVQVIVAGRLGTTFSFGDGKTLFEKVRNKKDFFVVEGAGHYDMYDKPQYVDQAIERLDTFYTETLNGQQGTETWSSPFPSMSR